MPAKALDTRKPLTTGQVARIVGVTTVTVREWITGKKLVAYALPGGTHVRVKHNELRAFLKRNKMPTDRLDAFEDKGWAAIEDVNPEAE